MSEMTTCSPQSSWYPDTRTLATKATPPKPKASVRKTRSSSDTTITPPTVAAAMTEAQQLKLVTKRSLHQIHISQASGYGANEETEEEEDELYRDVNINQGMGIQTTQEIKDSYMTLTPVNLDGQQQSSSVSSQFVTSMLNPTLRET
nr:hypothetical protein [Tanacetum cinerariifolium]